jgi:hypothetical protein
MRVEVVWDLGLGRARLHWGYPIHIVLAALLGGEVDLVDVWEDSFLLVRLIAPFAWELLLITVFCAQYAFTRYRMELILLNCQRALSVPGLIALLLGSNLAAGIRLLSNLGRHLIKRSRLALCSDECIHIILVLQKWFGYVGLYLSAISHYRLLVVHWSLVCVSLQESVGISFLLSERACRQRVSW